MLHACGSSVTNPLWGDSGSKVSTFGTVVSRWAVVVGDRVVVDPESATSSPGSEPDGVSTAGVELVGDVG